MEPSAELCVVFLAVLLASVILPMYSVDETNFLTARSALIKSENCARLGSNVKLDTNEKMVSSFLLMEKQKVINAARLNRSIYMPAASFFLSKRWMQNTPVFKIISKMPKGAALHIHELALTSLDWLISNLTYRDNAYMCKAKHGYLKFAVFSTLSRNPDCAWKSVKQERTASGNAALFNERLKKNLSLLATDPLKTFETPSDAQRRLEIYQDQVENLIRRPTVLTDYLTQAIKEFQADNVLYMEVRARLTGMIDEHGEPVSPEGVLEMYENVGYEIVNKFRNFSGLRIIHTSPRYSTPAEVLREVQLAMKLRGDYSDILVGFDLDGFENPGQSLSYYLDALLFPTRSKQDLSLPYFFHASENLWFGTDADENIVDAVMLNVSRIGHAYSLPKYAKTMDIIKDKMIGIEVNPISNQVMGLVQDLRNHAIIPVLTVDTPILISSDYPAAWEALPLSHDLYVSFMALSSKNSGLRYLKEMITHSI
ncbi:unnamed protein product, partial [Candidula unifasciata]